MRSVRARLTYANVMATVAVFVALGGSSYAALTVTGKNVKDSSLTGRDVKNGSLTTSDVKNSSLLATDFKSGQLPKGAQGASGSPGAPGSPGSPGAPGAPGSAVAYAYVTVGGAVDPSRSKNVTSSVGTPTNSYCISPTVPVKNVVATRDLGAGEIEATFGDPLAACPAGTVATVQTFNSAGANASAAFFVAFN
jgi:hypothetical protein